MKLYRYNNAGLTAEEYTILMEAAQGMDSVLEFGPGSSTWAFVEAGVRNIVSCEFDPRWLEKTRVEFEGYADVLEFDQTQYPLIIPRVEAQTFDLILVDSPVGLHGKKTPRFKGYEDCSRWNTMCWAIEHSDLIFLHDAHRPGEKETLRKVEQLGYTVTLHKTQKGLAEIRKC